MCFKCHLILPSKSHVKILFPFLAKFIKFEELRVSLSSGHSSLPRYVYCIKSCKYVSVDESDNNDSQIDYSHTRLAVDFFTYIIQLIKSDARNDNYILLTTFASMSMCGPTRVQRAPLCNVHVLPR